MNTTCINTVISVMMHVLLLEYDGQIKTSLLKLNVIATPMGCQYTLLRMTPLRVSAVAMETFDLYL